MAGTVVSLLYQGSASGTLVVSKANQTITFAQIPNQLTNTTYMLSATASSGLSVSFAVVAGGSIATLTGGTTLQFNSTTGLVSVAASQAGNGNYYAATSLTNTFLVTNSQARGATTFYVATNGSDSASGLTWATAKQTIQGAVDQTLAGDTVLVSNGVYATGCRVTPGYTVSNRVVIAQNITVQSVNGPAVTTIQGIKGAAGTVADSMRCVCITSGTLSGFTLTNGAAIASGDSKSDQSGGGAYAKGGILNRCVIVGCRSWFAGGGCYGGTVNNSLVAGNTASNATVNTFGGGLCDATASNCTIVGNNIGSGNGTSGGGGVSGCQVCNGIIYNNVILSAGSGANYEGSSSFTTSCTTPPYTGGTGDISGDPQFVNAAAGNFHLQATSPCINAGNTASAPGTTDLDGNPRTVNTTVDMGAYEYQSASTVLLTATAGAHGTVTPASTNASIGSSPVFSIQASAYYRILSLTTNGTSVGAFNNNSTSTNFIWSNVQAAGTLNANFTDQVTPDPGHPTYTWLHAHGFATDTNCVNGSDSPTTHGLLVWQEFLAGTDPTNPASKFCISGITPVGGSNTVQWLSSATVQAPYNLFYSTNLVNGAWTLYTNNIAPTPPTNSLTLPKLGSSPAVFYKVTVTATN